MSRGRLRIYLGAAPGVGKTYAMLDEGQRRFARGADVVVALAETHGRPHTEAQLDGLEIVPRRTTDLRGAPLTDMDLDAVLERSPAVALVDELAHTNVAGSRHTKRWEDVGVLLDAGIDVVSTLDIVHLESVQDVVVAITGLRPAETVPDRVVREADQIELVDMSPEALRRRLAHGNIYGPDVLDAALSDFFRVGNLTALRELALRWMADNVEEGLRRYRDAHDIDEPWETHERVVVALTGATSGDHLIRRAARMATRARGALVGVHVRRGDGLTDAPTPSVAAHRQLLDDLGGRYHEVVGADVAEALTATARSLEATQLVLGASRRSRAAELFGGSVINKVIRLSGPIDVHVISTDGPVGPTRLPALGRRRSSLPRRRRIAGWAVAGIGIPLLTTALLTGHPSLSLSTILLLNLLLVAVVAALGGVWPAVVAAVVSAQTVNWYFTEPIETFWIDDSGQVVAMVVFVTVGVLVGVLVGQAARRSAEANRARAEAGALAGLAGGLSSRDDPLQAMLGHLRITFGQESAAILVRGDDGGWTVDLADGEPVPTQPLDGDSVDLTDGLALVLVPGQLEVEDRRVLQAFAAQLAAGLERRALEAAAVEVDARSRADELRTAILRAVSHDLRSPLASIKASSTSLLQEDIDWSPEQRREFASTIDEEADRLNRLVANLLDMSRIEAGAVRSSNRGVAIDDVVASALDSVADADHRVEVAVPDDLPEVRADAALLERVVANLTLNALQHSPPTAPVRIEADVIGDRAVLRIIDQGTGIDAAGRDEAFDAFQRLDDSSTGGVGLGLAVVKGFVTAMGGDVGLDDTPGGGLTATVTLRLPGGEAHPAPAPLVGAP